MRSRSPPQFLDISNLKWMALKRQKNWGEKERKEETETSEKESEAEEIRKLSQFGRAES